MLSNSPSFLIYVEGRLLNKLLQLAKYAWKLSDSTKGRALGRMATSEESELFLNMLLCALKIWGTTFQKYESIYKLDQDCKAA